MRPAFFEHPLFRHHELLDSGAGEKLERFGEVVLVRPDPQALWARRKPEFWKRADLVFVRESDRGGRWEAGSAAPGWLRAKDPSWTLRYADCRFVVRPTRFKHLGVFPEQASSWEWVRSRFDEVGKAAQPRLLNLFGYTGVASVLAAQAGYQVTHVDASKSALNWLRENVAASGLATDAIRVVLEDAMTFLGREVRRGNNYEGILVDPPHYGRGPKGEKWQFEEGIAALLERAAKLLSERSFLILSSYAIGTSPLAMANLLESLPLLDGGRVEAGELALPESSAGSRRLPCGFCARWSRSS